MPKTPPGQATSPRRPRRPPAYLIVLWVFVILEAIGIAYFIATY